MRPLKSKVNFSALRIMPVSGLGADQHCVRVSSLHPMAAACPWHPPSWPCIQHWFVSLLPNYQPDFPVDLNTLTWKLHFILSLQGERATPLSITVSATPVSTVGPAKAGWRGISATAPSVSTPCLCPASLNLSLLRYFYLYKTDGCVYGSRSVGRCWSPPIPVLSIFP